MPCLEKTCLKDFSTISNTNLSMRFFFLNMSQADCRAIVWRQSYDVRANVANMPQRNFGEFTMRKFLDTRIIVV